MVIALVTVLTLLVAAAAAYIFDTADTTLARRADAVLAVVSSSAAGPLWNIDPAAAQAMLAGLANEPDMVSAQLSDDRGAPFASYGPPSTGSGAGPSETVLEVPVSLDRDGTRKTVGTLRLIYTASRAHAAAWREVGAMVVAGIVATAAMAVCLVRMLRRFTVPLAQLTRVMDALQRGQFDRAIVPATGRSDELGDMARSLDGTLGELRAMNGELMARNERFDAALHTMAQGLCMLDADLRVIVSNQRFRDLFSLSDAAAIAGTEWSAVVDQIEGSKDFSPGCRDCFFALEAMKSASPDGLDFREELPDGRFIAVSHRLTASGGVVSTYEDVSERQRVEAQIYHMAHHDALTDLPNRTMLGERLADAASRVGRCGEMLAVLCLDLDRFKQVNDTLGHPAGDALLIQVAERARRELRKSDLIARLGGDEFAVLQLGITGVAEAAALAQRLVSSLSVPYDLDGTQVDIGVSIGVAMAPADATMPNLLLKHADMALYRAKADGRGVYRFFETGMDARAQAKRHLDVEVRRGFSDGEFQLFYQPLVCVRSERVKGFEALLRWRHPVRGLISPAEFIPIAEEIGLIGELGTWVLNEACREASTWRDQSIRVAVNVSPVQFRTRDLVELVDQALAGSSLDPTRLELEITESVLLQDSDATLDTLHQLRERGVRIAMDDFGTGYSSLGYLRAFPFDKIKIDQSFVKGLGDDAESSAIVAAIASLGTRLGITTTAEGVETLRQFEHIRLAGCIEAQGYLFSPPKSAGDALQWLSQRELAQA